MCNTMVCRMRRAIGLLFDGCSIEVCMIDIMRCIMGQLDVTVEHGDSIRGRKGKRHRNNNRDAGDAEPANQISHYTYISGRESSSN